MQELTRREFVKTVAAAGVLAAAGELLPARAAAVEKRRVSSPERGFISHKPASVWEEALISGNGKMGALVMSEPLNESIILSHERLFLPWHAKLAPPGTGAHLPEIRKMLADGHYQQAADFVVELSHKEGYRGKRWTDPFFPACALNVSIPPDGEARNYARTLDFATGVASVHWADARGDWARRVFVSRPDNVVVMSLKNPGNVTGSLRLDQQPADTRWWDAAGKIERGIKDFQATAEDGWLLYTSRYKLTDGGYACLARVIVTSGTIRVSDSRLHVSDAGEVLVLLRIVPLEHFASLDVARLKSELQALPASYDTLLKRHAREHGRLFNRARLDLGGADERELPSEDLVKRSHEGKAQNALLEKLFDAGRYAILSSCGELPPNLQGVWTGTWGAPWSGDYTQNGNVQSAIASLLSTNMPECMHSYFGYMDSLLEDSRTNAKRLYNARGIVVASRTSTHGLNNHFDATWPMTFWVAGAGWAARFYWDYYLYTGDKEFLAKRALPYMKETAAFYEDYLVEDSYGRYLFSPSYSPENNPGNNDSQTCVNATMDIAVAKELLTNLVTACDILNVETVGRSRWKAMLAKMPDYLVNADGAIKEWTWPDLADNYAHRHCSHLYPLFYGVAPDVRERPELVKAFRRALELRMAERRKEPGGGVMAFGLVQMGLAATSLGDRDATDFILDRLSRNYYYDNLASSHDPGNIFNTDLSGGLPAIIVKALVHADSGVIELLPSVPALMPKGRLTGVLLRGQVTVEKLDWTPDSVSATLVSKRTQTVRVTVPPHINAIERVREMKLPAGKRVRVSFGEK